MAAPNVFNTATITSDSTAIAPTAGATVMVTNATASAKVYMIKSLYISNINASVSGLITVDLFRGGAAYRVINNVSVPIQCTIIPIGTDAPMFLLEGDQLRLAANAVSLFEAICSYDIVS